MPDASLWLIPRDKVPFVKEVQELITSTIPSTFGSKLKERHAFPPHVTLISNIDAATTYKDASSVQSWLDGLTFPAGLKKEANEVKLVLDHLEAGDEFFRKLVIALNPDANLTRFAAEIRRQVVPDTSEDAANTWATKEYQPHLSLLYADLPRSDVQAKVPMVELQVGYGLGSLFDCCGGTFTQGGHLVLVDTSKPIGEWEVLGKRETPWVSWMMSRNLI